MVSDLSDASIEHEDLIETRKKKSKQSVLDVTGQISDLQQKSDNVPAEPIDINSVISDIQSAEEVNS